MRNTKYLVKHTITKEQKNIYRLTGNIHFVSFLSLWRKGFMMRVVINYTYIFFQATSVLKSAGVTPNLSPGLSPPPTAQASMRNGGEVRVRYCSTLLPEKQPLLARDTAVAERLFIVSQPENFSEQVLVDCFCRFGNLIDAYFMPCKFSFLFDIQIFSSGVLGWWMEIYGTLWGRG